MAEYMERAARDAGRLAVAGEALREVLRPQWAPELAAQAEIAVLVGVAGDGALKEPGLPVLA